MAEEFCMYSKLQKNTGTFFPSLDPKSEIRDYAGGFIPFHTAVIVPTAPGEGFVWSTQYDRLFAKPPGSDTTAYHKKSVSFTVIIYRAIGDTNPNQAYVYIGDWRLLKQSHQNHFIRIEDLIKRLDKGCLDVYAQDWATWTSGSQPFPVWNQFGTANVLNSWNNYFHELLTKDVARQFVRFFGFASAAAYPKKEPWSVVSRFFDKRVDGIELWFNVSKLYEAQFNEFVEKQVATAVSRRTANPMASTFIPSSWKIVSISSPNELKEFQENKMLVGVHPLYLYETWIPRSQLGELKANGMYQEPYRFAAEPDVSGIPIVPWTTETSTTVSRLKINATRNMVRDPSQEKAMKIGSNAAAKKVWKSSQVGQHNTDDIKDAEWLHRSAFSYGGLDAARPAMSSQHPENLILGTKATNTAMLRVEEFVKRFVLRENVEVVVQTTTSGEGANISGCIASVLDYRVELQGKHHQHLKFTFHTMDRLTPLRFDFELGRLVEAHWFDWESKSEQGGMQLEDEAVHGEMQLKDDEDQGNMLVDIISEATENDLQTEDIFQTEEEYQQSMNGATQAEEI